MTTILVAPTGSSEVHIDGQKFPVAADGTVSVPDKMGATALAAGCATPGVAVFTFTTAKRPTQGLKAGMMIFDTTLGKPIWRNAANSGWVDATGTSA